MKSRHFFSISTDFHQQEKRYLKKKKSLEAKVNLQNKTSDSQWRMSQLSGWTCEETCRRLGCRCPLVSWPASSPETDPARQSTMSEINFSNSTFEHVNIGPLLLTSSLLLPRRTNLPSRSTSSTVTRPLAEACWLMRALVMAPPCRLEVSLSLSLRRRFLLLLAPEELRLLVCSTRLVWLRPEAEVRVTVTRLGGGLGERRNLNEREKDKECEREKGKRGRDNKRERREATVAQVVE